MLINQLYQIWNKRRGTEKYMLPLQALKQNWQLAENVPLLHLPFAGELSLAFSSFLWLSPAFSSLPQLSLTQPLQLSPAFSFTQPLQLSPAFSHATSWPKRYIFHLFWVKSCQLWGLVFDEKGPKYLGMDQCPLPLQAIIQFYICTMKLLPARPNLRWFEDTM